MLTYTSDDVESRYDRLHDQLAECELLDPEAGEPEDWPAWTDEAVWELGPGTDPLPDSPPEPDPAPFEPGAADRRWWAALDTPTLPPIAGGGPEPDRGELARVREWHDRLEAVHAADPQPSPAGCHELADLT